MSDDTETLAEAEQARVCRICGATVTSGSDPAHDGATHDARGADRAALTDTAGDPT